MLLLIFPVGLGMIAHFCDPWSNFWRGFKIGLIIVGFISYVFIALYFISA